MKRGGGGCITVLIIIIATWLAWAVCKHMIIGYAVLLLLITLAAATYAQSRNILSLVIVPAGIAGGWLVATMFDGSSNTLSMIISFQPAAPAGVVTGRVVAILIALFIAGRLVIADQSDNDQGISLKLANNPALGTAQWGTWRTLGRHVAPGWPRRGEGGTVVGKLQDRVMRFLAIPPVSPHILVVGGTGSGKSTGYIMPNIFTAGMAGESLVVADPKGELLSATGGWLQSQGYDVQVFDLLSARGQSWNPVRAALDEREVDILADVLVRNAVAEAGGEKSYFFALEKTALMAVIELAKQLPAGQDNMQSVVALMALIPSVLGQLIRDSDSIAAKYAWGQVEGARTSPLVGLSAKLNIIRHTGSLLVPVTGEGIDFAQLKRDKTALYCILPVGDESVKPILAAFYTFLFRRLCTGEHNPNGLTVRLLLDEFANLGEINNFPQVIAVARGYGVHISVVLQALSQLRHIYGEAESNVIAGNCGLQLLLGTQDYETADIFSRALGYAAVRQRQDRVDHTIGQDYLRRSTAEITVKRPLLEPAEIMRLPARKGIALVSGKSPVAIDKIDFERAKIAQDMLDSGTVDVPVRADVPQSMIFDPLFGIISRRNDGRSQTVDDLFAN